MRGKANRGSRKAVGRRDRLSGMPHAERRTVLTELLNVSPMMPMSRSIVVK